jgi:hypothetical protein
MLSFLNFSSLPPSFPSAVGWNPTVSIMIIEEWDPGLRRDDV